MVGTTKGPGAGATAAGGARLLTPTPAGERHAHGDRLVAARAVTTAPVRSIEHSTHAEDLMRSILEEMGEDPDRAGLVETPRRVRESLAALTAGYEQDPATVVGEAVFEEAYDEMVVVRDIELYSLCEHHLLPFYGKAHVAYLPAGRIVGLSKLPRLVEVFARRLQVQERLTTQVAETVQELLQPRGVGVVIEAAHLCMMMRGVQKQNSTTITSCMLGEFRDNPKTRAEFLQLVQGR